MRATLAHNYLISVQCMYSGALVHHSYVPNSNLLFCGYEVIMV